MEKCIQDTKFSGFGEDLRKELDSLELALKRKYLQKRLKGNLNVAVTVSDQHISMLCGKILISCFEDLCVFSYAGSWPLICTVASKPERTPPFLILIYAFMLVTDSTTRI